MILSDDVTYASNVFGTYINVIILKAMLFSLIGFETQTYTIICETICNIIPLQLYVCDVYLLNHAILVVMLIYRGPA